MDVEGEVTIVVAVCVVTGEVVVNVEREVEVVLTSTVRVAVEDEVLVEAVEVNRVVVVTLEVAKDNVDVEVEVVLACV